MWIALCRFCYVSVFSPIHLGIIFRVDQAPPGTSETGAMKIGKCKEAESHQTKGISVHQGNSGRLVKKILWRMTLGSDSQILPAPEQFGEDAMAEKSQGGLCLKTKTDPNQSSTSLHSGIPRPFGPFGYLEIPVDMPHNLRTAPNKV